jgi:hypothetical protein
LSILACEICKKLFVQKLTTIGIPLDFASFFLPGPIAFCNNFLMAEYSYSGGYSGGMGVAVDALEAVVGLRMCCV